MKRPFIGVMLLLVLQTTPRAKQRVCRRHVVVKPGQMSRLAGARVTLNAVTTPAALSAPRCRGLSGALPAEAAIISVPSNSPSSIPSVTTDRDGRFVFQNLSAGLYSLQVLRNGYARQSYGQRTSGRSCDGDPPRGRAGAQEYRHGARPRGQHQRRGSGPDGQPQAGVPIQLLRATFNSSGQRTFQVEGTARTNDRGEYRLYWITPGRYYVSAGTAPGPNRSLNPNNCGGQPKRGSRP